MGNATSTFNNDVSFPLGNAIAVAVLLSSLIIGYGQWASNEAGVIQYDLQFGDRWRSAYKNLIWLVFDIAIAGDILIEARKGMWRFLDYRFWMARRAGFYRDPDPELGIEASMPSSTLSDHNGRADQIMFIDPVPRTPVLQPQLINFTTGLRPPPRRAGMTSEPPRMHSVLSRDFIQR